MLCFTVVDKQSHQIRSISVYGNIAVLVDIANCLRSRVIPIGKPMILQWLSDA